MEFFDSVGFVEVLAWFFEVEVGSEEVGGVDHLAFLGTNQRVSLLGIE